MKKRTDWKKLAAQLRNDLATAEGQRDAAVIMLGEAKSRAQAAEAELARKLPQSVDRFVAAMHNGEEIDRRISVQIQRVNATVVAMERALARERAERKLDRAPLEARIAELQGQLAAIVGAASIRMQ